MKTLELFAPFLPYVACIVGLYLLGNAWIAIAIYNGGIVVLLSCARRWPVQWRARGRATAVVVTLASAAAGPLLYLLWSLFELDHIQLAHVTSRLGLGGVSWWFFAVYLATVHPLCEEAYWRAFLGSSSPRPVVGDLLFGGYHAIVLTLYLPWPFVVVSCLAIAVAGWFWRRLCSWTGGLAWAVAAHAGADIGIVIAATALGADRGG